MYPNISIKTILYTLLWLCSSFAVAQAHAFKDIGLDKKELSWLQAHPDITLAYDGYFPPYSFINDSGELEGFSIDVFKLLSDRIGVRFQVHPETTWQNLYRAAQRREVDLVATMVKRPEREAWFNFSQPYIDKALVIVTQAEDQRISTREDLANKKLALVKQYHYVPQILKDFPSATPHYVDTILDALTAVSIGDADAAITFLGAGHYYRTKYLLSNLKYAAVYDKTGAHERIGVRKDWPELQSILNKALNSIPESKMQSLREKWLPVDYLESLVEIELSEKEIAWIKKHPTIRLGVDPEFAPFEYFENGQYAGMTSDYIRLLNQRLHLKMQVVPDLTWDQAVEKAKNQEIDVLPAVGLTEQRKQFLNYTQAYLKFYRVIVTRVDAPMVFSLSDLQDLNVSVQADSSHEGFLNENSDIQPIPYKTLKDAILAVSSGEADAFVGNVASTTYWIRKLNLTNLKVAAPASEKIQTLHFAVRKDWPELVNILQKGLDSISTRQQKNISDKWLAVEYEPVPDFTLLIRIVIGFSLVLLLVTIWNIILNHKVRERTKQLLYSAHYDQLTDLPNRFLILDRLMQRINEAQRNPSKVALLSIDLNDFKKINDTFGHEAGDQVLKDVAKRLRRSLRISDTLGRLGGDQFLVILSQLTDTADAAMVARSLLKSFEKSFTIGNRELSLNASIGISIYPDDGEAPEILLQNADSATHHAKEQLQGSHTFFTEALNKRVARRLQLEEQMRSALKRDEFYLAYQPKVEAKSKKIISYEALLRWENKIVGSVKPIEFIPLAESNGLINPIGVFVLETALEALAHWQQQFEPALTMAINLSPVQFRSGRLIQQIQSAINKTGIKSQSLELEITEGVLMSGDSSVGATLKQLRRMGIKLAMDDYGTGYSSLSYLRKYDFDTLKIDREFIADLVNSKADRELVAATIKMAHGLGMKVVAEGVETQEQSEILTRYGCDLLQGWHFGKPLTFTQQSLFTHRQNYSSIEKS